MHFNLTFFLRQKFLKQVGWKKEKLENWLSDLSQPFNQYSDQLTLVRVRPCILINFSISCAILLYTCSWLSDHLRILIVVCYVCLVLVLLSFLFFMKFWKTHFLRKTLMAKYSCPNKSILTISYLINTKCSQVYHNDDFQCWEI